MSTWDQRGPRMLWKSRSYKAITTAGSSFVPELHGTFRAKVHPSAYCNLYYKQRQLYLFLRYFVICVECNKSSSAEMIFFGCITIAWRSGYSGLQKQFQWLDKNVYVYTVACPLMYASGFLNNAFAVLFIFKDNVLLKKKRRYALKQKPKNPPRFKLWFLAEQKKEMSFSFETITFLFSIHRVTQVHLVPIPCLHLKSLPPANILCDSEVVVSVPKHFWAICHVLPYLDPMFLGGDGVGGVGSSGWWGACSFSLHGNSSNPSAVNKDGNNNNGKTTATVTRREGILPGRLPDHSLDLLS